MKKKSLEKFEKLIRCIKERSEYNDPGILSCFDRTDGIAPQNLLEKSFYHTECYKLITHTTNLQRLKERHASSISLNLQDPNIAHNDETDESCSQEPVKPGGEDLKKTLRSMTEVYNKNACIICQQIGGKLHKVEFTETGTRMFKVAEALPDKSFFVRMNSIPNLCDAVANVQYHLKCWVISERNALKTASEKQEIQEIEDVNRVIADVEIIEIVRQNFTGDGILDMNNLNKTYNNLYGNDNEVNYKRYLKRLFNETIPGVVFSRPPARRLSEQLYSADCQAKAIETYKNNSDDYTTIFEAAKIIRNELLKHRNWKFDGDFSGFDLPVSLSSLLRWIIVGPKNTVDTILKKNSIDNRVDNIAQIIVKASKSDRQVKHKSSPDANFREVVETPFSVGLGIHVHKETRSKKLIECLSDLGLSISYDKVMKIENDLGNAVYENISLNHGVFVPPNIQPGIPLHFAIDNIDFRNDTPDGKSEFHGTTHVVFQKNNKVNHELLKISRTKTFTFQHFPFQETNVTMKPNPPNEVFPD